MATSTTPKVTTIEQLSVSNPSYLADENDPTEQDTDDFVLPPSGFDRRTRPQSVRSTRSTTSRSSVNNQDGRVKCHDYHASKYFSYQVCDCEQTRIDRERKFTSFLESRLRKSDYQYSQAIFPDRGNNGRVPRQYFEASLAPDRVGSRYLSNGRFISEWTAFLSSVDHWDLHREVIVVLMENHIMIVRYNFIKERIIYSQGILFDDIRSVVYGPCCYPNRSIMGWGLACRLTLRSQSNLLSASISTVEWRSLMAIRLRSSLDGIPRLKQICIRSFLITWPTTTKNVKRPSTTVMNLFNHSIQVDKQTGHVHRWDLAILSFSFNCLSTSKEWTPTGVHRR